MGKPGDPNAVVDSHGKVFGVRRLRVVDISAFPLLPPGHSQSNVCKQSVFSMFFFFFFSFQYSIETDHNPRHAGGKVGRRH